MKRLWLFHRHFVEPVIHYQLLMNPGYIKIFGSFSLIRMSNDKNTQKKLSKLRKFA